MKFVTFKKGQSQSYGFLLEERVVDFPPAFRYTAERRGVEGEPPAHMEDFISQGEAMLAAARQIHEIVKQIPGEELSGISLPVEQAKLLSPLQRPPKIICIGLNYVEHAREGGRPVPEEPVVFGKFANSLVGPGEAIRVPRISQMIDYEAELAVVIGKSAYRVEKENALEYVFGYANFNDISARDLQRRDGQWMKGKFLDTFAPFGPYLATRDEVADPGNLDICLRLNGAVMQLSNTSDMIFDVPYLVSFLSQLLTLEPGDIIATGTPPGVGFARKPPVFLKPGDIVEVEISGLGVLQNLVVKG